MRPKVAGLLFTIIVLPAARALACECQAPTNLEENFAEEFDRAAAVFRGVSGVRSEVELDATYCTNFERLPALEQLKCWDATEIEFVVSQRWKGDVSDRMSVRTAARDASCGTGLDQGREYIVFAYAIPNDNALHMYLCSPTSPREADRFEELVAFLQRRASSGRAEQQQ
jgi:hypothetical protein